MKHPVDPLFAGLGVLAEGGASALVHVLAHVIKIQPDGRQRQAPQVPSQATGPRVRACAGAASFRGEERLAKLLEEAQNLFGNSRASGPKEPRYRPFDTGGIR
jgi:hypothetical protein